MPSRDHKLLIAAAVGTTAVVAAYVLLSQRGKNKKAADDDLADIDEASSAPTSSITSSSSSASSAVAATIAGEAAPDATAPTEPTAPSSTADEARRAKERGNKRFAGRQYEQAIAEYTKAIELADANDPDIAKYYGNRAQCLACLEKHAEAEADCDAGCARPALREGLARRATAREKLGKLESAISDFTGALLLSDMSHQTAAESIGSSRLPLRARPKSASRSPCAASRRRPSLPRSSTLSATTVRSSTVRARTWIVCRRPSPKYNPIRQLKPANSVSVHVPE